MTQQQPDISDEAILTVAHSLAPLAGGPRVTVLSARCAGCGEDWWPYGEGVTYTVAAAIVHDRSIDL